MKKVILILVFLVAIAGVVGYYMQAQSRANDDLSLVPVRRGTVTEIALAVGQIMPQQEISIKSKVRGILEKKFVEVGDVVQRGDPLTEINPDPTPLEYAQASRQMELAQITLSNALREKERIAELHAQEWASQQQYDNMRQTYDEALLRFEMARENFELISRGTIQMGDESIDNVIRSPVDGTVLEFLVNVGDPIVPLTTYQAGTPMMTVADMRTLLFKGTVDEIDVGKLQEGIPAEITIGALPEEALSGEVTLIAPKAKIVNNMTLFDIEITLSTTNVPALRAGYSATARIEIARAEDVLLLPERVVSYSNDVAFVRLPQPGGRGGTERRIVRTGVSDGMMTEIRDGIAENEMVVDRVRRD